ncbi:class I SAM-dependent methyltransferase [Candidatus Fermentibacterales bacterium]|nr:class I SAM-dependent methyltransferase [Candidatus Fermentibacterales bacterium]
MLARLARRIAALLPASAEDLLHRVAGRLRSLRYAGSRYRCPCCGGGFARMLSWDPSDPDDDNRMCPRCHSQSRHRLLLTYLERETGLFSQEVRLLHFAPERFLARIFRSRPGILYVPVDLEMSRVSARVDVTSLGFREACFDAIVCNHVLEHVPDDEAAIRELCRVLAPGGWAVVMAPVDHDRAETLEDPSVRDPMERRRLFGQSDHVRVYGRDYIDRLNRAEWAASELHYADELDPGLRESLALMEREYIYLARKPPAPPVA